MNCLILQGDEQTAAVAGFVNIEYHFLHFVLILKDGRHLPFFLRSLTLPARPRLNDFRWALLRTEIAQAPYYAQLRRFCRFGYMIISNSLVANFPNVKQLHDDACLRNLLRLHTQGTCQVTFYLEQCQASKWIPKNLSNSMADQAETERQVFSPETTSFNSNFSTADCSSTYAINNSTRKSETQRTSLSSWSSSNEIQQKVCQTRASSGFDYTDFMCHNNSSSSLPPSSQGEMWNSPVWPSTSIRNIDPQLTRVWTITTNSPSPFSEYSPPICYCIPEYIQFPWCISQWPPGFFSMT